MSSAITVTAFCISLGWLIAGYQPAFYYWLMFAAGSLIPVKLHMPTLQTAKAYVMVGLAAIFILFRDESLFTRLNAMSGLIIAGCALMSHPFQASISGVG